MRSAGFRALAAAAAATAGLLLPGAPAPALAASAAAAGDLFVSNATGSGCSDSGAGTQQQPFCTISAAAAVAQPGQTVLILPGDYPSLTITRSGTPGAPITFQADRRPGDEPVAVEAPPAATPTGSALTVSGAHDVVISGFVAAQTHGSPNILVENSADVTISAAASASPSTVDAPALEVTGTSSDVTISRSSLGGRTVPALMATAGVTGLVVTTSTLSGTGDTAPAAEITGSPGAVLTSNTIVTQCDAGIMLEGGSTGAVLENNILQSGGSCVAGTQMGIVVSADSVSGSASDYNLISPGNGGPLYDWAGTGYTSLADFTAATGQGVHDIAAGADLAEGSDQGAFWFTPGSASPAIDSPAIDSADANAPDELAADQLGDPRADDPAVANTGTGPGYFDRGSVELEGGAATAPAPVVTPDPAGGPLAVTVTAPITSAWPVNGPFGVDEFTFPDSQWPVITTSGETSHTFATAGQKAIGVEQFWDGITFTTTTVKAEVGADYTPVTPTRILDTRNGTGVAAGAVPAGGILTLPFAGVGPVPAAQVSAVNLNVTVTHPTQAGSLTVFSSAGGSASGTSNLNFAAGQTVASLVTVQPGATGIEFHNGSSGTVQVIADLDGYYGAAGSGLTPLVAPVRVLDTRSGTGAPKAAVAAGATLALDLSGQVPAGATAAVLNVTVTQPKAAGFLTAFGDGQAVPQASAIDFVPGQTVANQVIVPLVNGKADFFNGSGGTIQLVADLSGYFSAASPGAFVPVGPVRIADTRTGQGGVSKAAVLPGGFIEVSPQVFAGSTAMVLNVTVTQPKAAGFLTVYPGAQPRPGTSNLNFRAGQTVAVQATVVGNEVAGNNVVVIYNGGSATVQIVVDQQGDYISPS
jgi:hypothetical protein